MLHRSILLLGVLAISASQAVAAEKPVQPDILLIMPDQMRGDCLSILGHSVVSTPQMDELARGGMLFRRAYTTVPSCIPARYSLLTGLFPQTSGVVGFRARRIACSTLPQSLREVGYSTVLVGRNMHQIPASNSYGYETRILGSTYLAGDDYDKFLRKAVPNCGGIRKVVADLGVTFNHWQAKPWPMADDLHPTAWIVQEARKVLTETPVERPLFLTASFYAPHPPLFPPKKHFDACLEKTLPAPAHGDWVDWKSLSSKGNKSGHRILLEGDTLRHTQAGYFGLIQHLDEQITPLIAEFKLRSENASRPWLVVVTSDHGEMLGDHGFFRKCEPYEGSANIPFIVTGSKDLGFRPGERCLQPVCLEDVMPTLLDLGGAHLPKPMDGISLVPVLRGEKRVIREQLHFEHAPCYSKEQAFHALTDGHFKYIWRPADGTDQLFNLDLDPLEERDLSKDATQSRMLDRWRGRLIQRLANRPEGFSDGGTLISGRPYPPLHSRMWAE
jgi:arylsulfatase